jgi:hypothetical protein
MSFKGEVQGRGLSGGVEVGLTIAGELHQLFENTLGPLVRHCEIGGVLRDKYRMDQVSETTVYAR